MTDTTSGLRRKYARLMEGESAGIGLEGLRAAIRPEFLVEAGWDEASGILAPPRDHPLLGLRKCAVADCLAGVRSTHVDLCATCERRFQGSDLEFADFVETRMVKRSRGEKFCVVQDCERPSHVQAGLCYGHYHHWRQHQPVSVVDWIATTRPAGLPSWGPCLVRSCVRQAACRRRLCHPHRQRLRAHLKEHSLPDNDDTRDKWAEDEGPIQMDHFVVLKGLPERVVLELLLSVQQRTDEQTRFFITVFRGVVGLARAHAVASIAELLEVPIDRSRHDISAMIRAIATGVSRALASPETESLRDVWDLSVFNARGYLDFTEIRQPWLRDGAKHWALEDLPSHRGKQSSATSKRVVAALSRLSESLWMGREDHGLELRALQRRDIIWFLNRLAHLESTGVITRKVRLRALRDVRRAFDEMEGQRLHVEGQPLHGLPPDFQVLRGDIPSDERPDEAGRDLPDSVLVAIIENLDSFEARSGREMRVITDVLIDTGRRPDEVCSLPLNCLSEDKDGKDVLVYTDSKTHRPGRRLPINLDTAKFIRDQQARVLELFPDTRRDDLCLFPRAYQNRDGTNPVTQASYGSAHRIFIDGIADRLFDSAGDAYPAGRVTPYCYRHCFCQRHADNGVAPDALAELMGHEKIESTAPYYRVKETRVRSAMDQMSRHQFDGQARPLMGRLAGLMADEHTRMQVAQVAVPFGACTEPSNVKAGGHACPFKYTCPGCGHFRSDASHLPELKSYLQQLLADRERVMATETLQDWAREKAMPAPQEIEQVRDLIRRIELDLDQLSDEDKATIEHAIQVVRAARQTVTLGMPSVRPRS